MASIIPGGFVGHHILSVDHMRKLCGRDDCVTTKWWFVMMCWGDYLEVLIQCSCAPLSPGVCVTLTHTIFIVVLLSDTYYSDLSSLALFLSKTCLNERGNFLTLLPVWKQSCFVITGLWQRPYDKGRHAL